MLKNKTIAVVVPAYNEEIQIIMVIESMPEFVDRIVVVNDCSTDNTAQVVEGFINKDNRDYFNDQIGVRYVKRNAYNEAEIIIQQKAETELKYYVPSQIINTAPEHNRIILINHLKNGGVGASIAQGYKWARDNHIDCTAVMAGDGQMDPSELESICLPIIENSVDYVKGNRLIHRSAKYIMPMHRFLGNSILSILTKIASGYWRVSDTQTGYTAISLSALNAIDLFDIYKSYGMPNDLLVKLNIASCTLKEVPTKPVYRIGEHSKMKIWKVMPKIAGLLVWSFFYRLWLKYFFRNFHPLFLLYNMALILMFLWLPYLFKVFRAQVLGTNLSFETLFAFIFLGIFGFQSLLFAMWMDIQDNERLYK